MYVEFQKEWLSKAGSKIREMTLHLKEPNVYTGSRFEPAHTGIGTGHD